MTASELMGKTQFCSYAEPSRQANPPSPSQGLAEPLLGQLDTVYLGVNGHTQMLLIEE